jgi:hypothetical protein
MKIQQFHKIMALILVLFTHRLTFFSNFMIKIYQILIIPQFNHPHLQVVTHLPPPIHLIH